MTGTAPETIYNPSAFDQGYCNDVGIECCNYGPGEHQFAHTDLDMASVDRAFDAAKGVRVHDRAAARRSI